MRKLQFDWDLWNIQKNEIKHGISVLEAESCFFDPSVVIFEDLVHSTIKEKRYVLYALSLENRILMVVFTVRRGKVRIFTTRMASKKERQVYEEKKQTNH